MSKPVIIFDTGERFRPHLVLDESGLLEFKNFEPYYDGNEKVFYRIDPIKEQLLIDAITDRMAKIGVAPGDKSRVVSFNKGGFPTYYGKTIHYFINCTLRHMMCYSYSNVRLHPWNATFDGLLHFIKYKIPDRSFVVKSELSVENLFVEIYEIQVFALSTSSLPRVRQTFVIQYGCL